MTFFLLIVVVLFLGFRMTTAQDRERFLQTGLATAYQLKAIATRPRPEVDRFHSMLRDRTPRVLLTPALGAVMMIVAFLAASGTADNGEALLRWGASYGPRTTNGEWWRLITSLFVHPGLVHAAVNTLAFVQAGWILERLTGRATLLLAFIASGAIAGIVSLSTHAVAVTSGASGAVFGVYGLMAASIVLTGRVSDPPDEFQIAFPPLAIRRLVPVGAVFVLFNLMSGALPFSAELAGFATGLIGGIVIVRGVGTCALPPPRVAAGSAVAFVIVTVFAWPLNGMADVRPEIARVVATEDRTAAAYQSAAEALRKGKMTPDAVAHVIDKTITPELEAVDARLKALKHVPREHQPLVDDAEEYLRLRSESWKLRAESLRKSHVIPARKSAASDTVSDASWRLRAEAQFRNNRLAAGKAEGVERSSLEVLARLRPAPNANANASADADRR